MTPVVHCKYDTLAAPGDLVPHPRNPNTHPERQLKALEAFVAEQGWRHAVVVSVSSGHIAAGHARCLVAERNGWLVPVVYQCFASEAEELAFVVADNRLAELAVIDVVALDASLRELDVDGRDMATLGFDLVPTRVRPVQMPTVGTGSGESPRGGADVAMSPVRVLLADSVRGEVLATFRELADRFGAERFSWRVV